MTTIPEAQEQQWTPPPPIETTTPPSVYEQQPSTDSLPISATVEQVGYFFSIHGNLQLMIQQIVKRESLM